MANRKDLINGIAAETGMTKKDAKVALEAIIDSMKSALADGEKVQLVGFGSFQVVERAARKGRNPQTGDEINIPAKNVVKFKAGKGLAEVVDA